MMKHLRLAPLAAAVIVLAAGCSGMGNKSTEYRTAGSQAAQRPLEVPPELSTPTVEDRFAIPDAKAATSYSAYNRDRASPQQPAAQAASAVPSGVLPKIEGARMDRYGDQRWLVVKGEPASVWAAVREFWLDAGFLLQREIPEAGIMETNWGETRAKIPQGAIRDAIGKFLEGSSTNAERDKFRTRLEKGVEPGTTEVYVSHRGMQEVYASPQQERAVWQPREADKELEAEMLARMMVRLGSGDRRTLAAAATPGATASPGAAKGGPAAPDARNAVLQNAGAGPLVVNDGFDRAWRRVGLALDRVGFTVEDRDRSKGVYFVRYVDPESDVLEGQKQSYLEKFMFWKPAPKVVLPQYRILVSDAGASLSQVEVKNAEGGPESSATGKKILALLYDQLK